MSNENMCMYTFNELWHKAPVRMIHVDDRFKFLWRLILNMYSRNYWTKTLSKISGAEMQTILSFQSQWYSLQTFFTNTKDTTFIMDRSCYFCTFILPYWQHMRGSKLMWSISKSGPKLCQMKDTTSTQSQCHCEKPFLVALSLFWSYPV